MEELVQDALRLTAGEAAVLAELTRIEESCEIDPYPAASLGLSDPAPLLLTLATI